MCHVLVDYGIGKHQGESLMIGENEDGRLMWKIDSLAKTNAAIRSRPRRQILISDIRQQRYQSLLS